MFEMKKKAQERSEIVKWVVAVLILVIFGIFIYKVYIETPAILDKETCRESVTKRALWGINALPEETKPELQCKTQKIEIKSTNQNEIKKQIANAMFDCWDMLGRGEIDLFGVTYGDWGPEINKRCIICSTISFDDNVQKRVSKVNNLIGYMNKEKIPRKNITYWQFLTNKEDVSFDSNVDVTSFLDTKERYAVVFVAIRKLSSTSDFVTFYGARVGTGAAIGTILPIPGVNWVLGGTAGLIVAIGERINYGIQVVEAACSGESGCYSLLLVPYNREKLADACESLESLP